MPEAVDHRAEAARAIWRWRESNGDRPLDRRGRRRRLIIGALLGFVAAALAYRRGHLALACVPAALSLFSLLAAFLAPARIVDLLDRALASFGEAVARIVAVLVLTPLYLLVLTPLALVLRLTGRDPLQLAARREAPSFWVKRTAPSQPERPF